MPITVEFKFSPRSEVKIVSYGLNCSGTVIRCIRTRGGNSYEVEYALNSEIRQREFWEEQLVGAHA